VSYKYLDFFATFAALREQPFIMLMDNSISPGTANPEIAKMLNISYNLPILSLKEKRY
jgi:hypothetical protein